MFSLLLLAVAGLFQLAQADCLSYDVTGDDYFINSLSTSNFSAVAEFSGIKAGL